MNLTNLNISIWTPNGRAKAKYKKLWKIKQDLIVIEAESEGVKYERQGLRERIWPKGPWG